MQTFNSFIIQTPHKIHLYFNHQLSKLTDHIAKCKLNLDSSNCKEDLFNHYHFPIVQWLKTGNAGYSFVRGNVTSLLQFQAKT